MVVDRDDILRKMRMAFYRNVKALQKTHDEIDGMWCHHLDGSDLVISKDDLWTLMQHKVLPSLTIRIDKTKIALSGLKKIVGW